MQWVCSEAVYPPQSHDMFSDLFFFSFLLSRPLYLHSCHGSPLLYIWLGNLELILLSFASAQVNSAEGDWNVCGSDVRSE